MALTTEQLEMRRGGITATDMTKIVGVSNYGSAIDVLLDKQGIVAPFVETDRVKWGNLLEGPIRDDYADRHGVTIAEPGTIVHPDLEWAMATPDGIVYEQNRLDGPLRGWEGKTHTGWMSHLYGEPGSDEVPAWELVQCAWNTWIARAKYGVNIERWDLTVFMDGLPADYIIKRDPELEEILVAAGRTFWEDYVKGGKELEPDGSSHYSRHLAGKWEGRGQDMVTATPETLKAIGDLRSVRECIKTHEVNEARLVQVIKEAIGDNAGVQIDESERVTWKRSKESRRVDWKAVAQEYRGILQLVASGEAALDEDFAPTIDATIERFTKSSPGSRRFVVPRSWNK